MARLFVAVFAARHASGRYLASGDVCEYTAVHEHPDDRDRPRKATRRCCLLPVRSIRSSARNHLAIRTADTAAAQQNSRRRDRDPATRSLAGARSANSVHATHLPRPLPATSRERRRNRQEERSAVACYSDEWLRPIIREPALDPSSLWRPTR